jgi:hypothetical protein
VFMRPAPFVCLTLAAVSACSERENRVVFAQVNWMEWPAEVLATQPFSVRLEGYGVGCNNVVRFDPGTTVDNSAVTFEPFFLVSGPPVFCPLSDRPAGPSATSPVAPFFDTRAPVNGLPAQFPRSYEVRGATDVSAPGPVAESALPVRTFGEIVVRSDAADPSRVNAGGRVYAVRDSTGCVEIYVGSPSTQYVVENPPADTATYWSGFVQGYIYKPAAPLCGANEVFHLISRN